MKTIVILGGNSQLAKCIKKTAKNFPDLHLLSFSSKEANITNLQQLKTLFKKHQPQVVINCAAYTAVDRAEDEYEKAAFVNAKAPATIAKCCKEHGVFLIHISTDFVFQGNRPIPLVETDPTYPINVYGRTKLAGERAILKNLEKYIIIRTSWLYSEFGHNFVKTMLRLGMEKSNFGVVSDQIGTPTYAIDLATVILKISNLDLPKPGIYHFSNEGVASWYDFAHAIFDLAEMKLQLLPLTTIEYPTKAARPAFSVLDKSMIKKTFDITIPHWQDSLRICLNQISTTK